MAKKEGKGGSAVWNAVFTSNQRQGVHFFPTPPHGAWGTAKAFSRLVFLMPIAEGGGSSLPGIFKTLRKNFFLAPVNTSKTWL
jgi:hypothetical protein